MKAFTPDEYAAYVARKAREARILEDHPELRPLLPSNWSKEITEAIELREYHERCEADDERERAIESFIDSLPPGA